MPLQNFLTTKKGFASLIGLILTIAIILFLCYILFNNYFRMSSFDNSTRESLFEQGIVTSNPVTILDSTRGKIKAIEKQGLDREKQAYEGMR